MAAIVLAAVVAGGISARVFAPESKPAVATSKLQPTSQTQPGATPRLEDAVRVAQPAVVEVRTRGSQGSGVIVAPLGLIVTNYHVVGEATRVEVTNASGQTVSADVVRSDEPGDLAILRPSSPIGPGVEMVDDINGPPPVGESVFAIGSPFGLRNTVTAGIVSAFRTDGENAGRPLIQFDAPVNPGNSGGGLFDLYGTLVGIPTSIVGPIPGNVGIGFAVPTSRVRKLLAEVS